MKLVTGDLGVHIDHFSEDDYPTQMVDIATRKAGWKKRIFVLQYSRLSI